MPEVLNLHLTEAADLHTLRTILNDPQLRGAVGVQEVAESLHVDLEHRDVQPEAGGGARGGRGLEERGERARDDAVQLALLPVQPLHCEGLASGGLAIAQYRGVHAAQHAADHRLDVRVDLCLAHARAENAVEAEGQGAARGAVGADDRARAQLPGIGAASLLLAGREAAEAAEHLHVPLARRGRAAGSRLPRRWQEGADPLHLGRQGRQRRWPRHRGKGPRWPLMARGSETCP
mmetsp:Transcript_78092/g.220839  ORF Transcript_78092/g.220839 Transcript_78092/m.220839 type:complete len:234 (+) Transcript_78092:514-1215(+)